MLKRPAILCAGLLFAAVLVFGVVRLFELRLDHGDIYPAYSTLRADPLGTSVFYESLDRVSGVTPQRTFEETLKLEDGPGHTLFVLGAEPLDARFIPRPEFDILQRFVYDGGRVVFAFEPYPDADPQWLGAMPPADDEEKNGSRRKNRPNRSPTSVSTNQIEKAEVKTGTNTVAATNEIAKIKPSKKSHGRNTRRAQKSPDEKQDEDDQPDEPNKDVDLTSEWGFHFKTQALNTNEDGSHEFPAAVLSADKTGLPPQLVVHTPLCFANLTNGWKVIYERDKKTSIIIERKFGAGSVVFVADAYPFSNEAMFKDRSASLMSWMLGGGRDVLFDESHFGIVEQPGMATLLRRYQLHGLIISLLLVAGLFVWKNSLSLVPPYEDDQAGGGLIVAGRDSASGFVNLVRRSITPAEIINVSFAEWKKSGARMAALSPTQRRDLEQLIQQQAALEPGKRKPVENYRVISQILKRRK